jgi:hypothetical protein
MAVVMTKDVLVEPLCALVPKPHQHPVTHHRVLAPAADAAGGDDGLAEGPSGCGDLGKVAAGEWCARWAGSGLRRGADEGGLPGRRGRASAGAWPGWVPGGAALLLERPTP